MAIRYDRSLQTEIRRVVKNFNAKRRRLEKQGRKDLPPKVSVKELKGFTRRRELYTALSDLRRFSKKGAENRVKIQAGNITKWELETLKQRSRRAKISISRRLKGVEEREKSAPYKGMVRDFIKNLQYQREYLDKDITKMSGARLRTYRKIVDRNEDRKIKNETFYENFFDMLFKDAYVAGIDQERLDALEKKLRKLTPEQLALAYNEEPVLHNILEKYKAYVNVDQGRPELKRYARSTEIYRTIEEQLDTAIKLAENNADRIVARYRDL